jgi:hypothetical protein
MACWLEQPTSNKDFCDEIDEIMKHEHEHEDVILLNDALSSGAPLDIEFDSISDLLETPSTLPVNSSSAISPMSPSSSSSTDYTRPHNIYDMPPTTRSPFLINNNNSQSSTTASAYSSLGISPKFTTLSINHHHPFSPSSQDSNNSSSLLQPFVQSPITINSKNNLHPPLPPYVQQQDNSILGTSYPFELQVNNGPSDVKRFRSASMNEGATQQQQTKLGK